MGEGRPSLFPEGNDPSPAAPIATEDPSVGVEKRKRVRSQRISLFPEGNDTTQEIEPEEALPDDEAIIGTLSADEAKNSVVDTGRTNTTTEETTEITSETNSTLQRLKQGLQNWAERGLQNLAAAEGVVVDTQATPQQRADTETPQPTTTQPNVEGIVDGLGIDDVLGGEAPDASPPGGLNRLRTAVGATAKRVTNAVQRANEYHDISEEDSAEAARQRQEADRLAQEQRDQAAETYRQSQEAKATAERQREEAATGDRAFEAMGEELARAQLGERGRADDVLDITSNAVTTLADTADKAVDAVNRLPTPPRAPTAVAAERSHHADSAAAYTVDQNQTTVPWAEQIPNPHRDAFRESRSGDTQLDMLATAFEGMSEQDLNEFMVASPNEIADAVVPAASENRSTVASTTSIDSSANRPRSWAQRARDRLVAERQARQQSKANQPEATTDPLTLPPTETNETNSSLIEETPEPPADFSTQQPDYDAIVDWHNQSRDEQDEEPGIPAPPPAPPDSDNGEGGTAVTHSELDSQANAAEAEAIINSPDPVPNHGPNDRVDTPVGPDAPANGPEGAVATTERVTTLTEEVQQLKEAYRIFHDVNTSSDQKEHASLRINALRRMMIDQLGLHTVDHTAMMYYIREARSRYDMENLYRDPRVNRSEQTQLFQRLFTEQPQLAALVRQIEEHPQDEQLREQFNQAIDAQASAADVPEYVIRLSQQTQEARDTFNALLRQDTTDTQALIDAFRKAELTRTDYETLLRHQMDMRNQYLERLAEQAGLQFTALPTESPEEFPVHILVDPNATPTTQPTRGRLSRITSRLFGS